MYKGAHKGFSLVEVLIVMGILAIVAAFTTAADTGSLNRTNVTAEERKLVELLVHARSQAMNNENEKPHGVFVGPTEFVLFEGASFASATKTQGTPRDLSINHSGATEVVFAQLSGATSVANMLLSGNGKTAAISINTEGRIEW